MDSNEALANYVRYRSDPWAFISECVYTKDEVDQTSPIKLFPNRDYLKFYTKLWSKYPMIAVPKSRRMTMSWVTISLYVWDAMFHRSRFFAFVSKKEDDADALVKRAKFIVDNLDRNKIPEELIPKYKDKFCVLEFTELDSKIQGFPMGADQLRQFTFSGIFGDESAFWEKAEKFYAASFPTIDGGGRMTLVSSPAPGFFKKLCFDCIDVPGDINVADHVPDFKRVMTGTRLWQNRKNKFVIFELHYTADPTKRDPIYRDSIKNSMPYQEYMREYELHWDTFEGQPVYPEFGKIHITEECPIPVPGLPMLIGIDFGLCPAAVVGQYCEGVLTIFREYIEINMGSTRFMDLLIPQLIRDFPGFGDFKKGWKCFIDPSGLFRKDTDERTTAMDVAKYFNPEPGPVAWEERRKGVVEFLMKLEKGIPAFQVYDRGAPMLIKGFEGGYRFPEKAVEVEPNKLRPIKDGYSHCFPGYILVETIEGEKQIKDVRIGDYVLAPGGKYRVVATMNREATSLVRIEFSSGRSLVCTPDHQIWSNDNFVRADALQYCDEVIVNSEWEEKRNFLFKNSLAQSFIKPLEDIINQILNLVANTCTELFGFISMDQSIVDKKFITKMKINPTIESKTWNFYQKVITPLCIAKNKLKKIENAYSSTWKKSEKRRLFGIDQKKDAFGIESTQKEFQEMRLLKHISALFAGKVIKLKKVGGSEASVEIPAKGLPEEDPELMTRQGHVRFVRSLLGQTNILKKDTVLKVVLIKKSQKVFDLTVESSHCFYANGVLVKNCHDGLQYLCVGVKSLILSTSRQIPRPQYAPPQKGVKRA